MQNICGYCEKKGIAMLEISKYNFKLTLWLCHAHTKNAINELGTTGLKVLFG